MLIDIDVFWFVVCWRLASFGLLISLVLVILGFVVLFVPCLRVAKSPTSRKAPGIDMESVKESSVGSCVEKLMNGHRDLHGVGMVRLRVVRGESTVRDRQPTSGSAWGARFVSFRYLEL